VSLTNRQLQLRISDFMLRRTAELNEQYLPDKVTYTIFCRPSRLQVHVWH
jgi:SNF2 family DNA or RNA helicase